MNIFRFVLKVSIIIWLHLRTVPAVSEPVKVRPETINFQIQSLLEPYEVIDCQHKKKEGLPFDWTVECKRGKYKKLFHVHLALAYYPNSSRKKPAYQLLYWITDTTARSQDSRMTSSTVWFYQKKDDDRLSDIEFSQGIENDNAYLKLSLNL